MANSSVGVVIGTGAFVDTFQVGSGDHQQYVREAPASAATAPTSWTLATSASTSVLAADESRRFVILTLPSTAVGTVYIRYDGTAPTVTVGGYHDAIAPGGRLVVEKECLTLAMSFIASAVGGALNIGSGTAT